MEVGLPPAGVVEVMHYLPDADIYLRTHQMTD
jgi:hypothetical protein